MKLLLFEKNEIHPEAIKLLKQNGIDVMEIIPNQSEIDAVFIRTYTKINSDFLDIYPNLKFIIRAGVGLDNIDSEECKKKNIRVFNSPGSNSNAVAELVISYILMLLRKMPRQINSLKQGKWRDKEFMGEELKNKIVGLVGCGAIGKLIAKKLENFGVGKFVGFDPFLSEEGLKENNIRKVELEELIKISDIITLHLPLTQETKNLISEKQFSLMKKNAFLINTSRGGIVNEKDLIKTLKEGKISGAALDVFENEPNMNKELLEIENLIATPHIGAYTHEADRAMSVEAVKNFLNFLNPNNG
ncbi:MAG: D-3-phosphoglycerate dehydrogenase [Candidatus Gottesmanbacteria bacterium GW2011_GWC2_39_8]|uniref:D-3-phosphoglycerate dehydrogenase n=1 Tax=Candidatus Gottesmanbacteria bacterium GW2011_GWC2_39_8 TaxID=1618450 RepID=A0A0G0PY79_9BACT|nr:MAG: D-3-phosphoglycerate dehydrogenase [Candidatus Gottesmanbacteria bacterium GW2011_GWC2_39_8]